MEKLIPIMSLLLCGCANTQEANELRIDRDGNFVTGTVVASWTDEQLRNNLLGVVCEKPGEFVADISTVRYESGVVAFKAICLAE